MEYSIRHSGPPEAEPGTQGIVERGACDPWVPDRAPRVQNDGVCT
jgi:hypothetical protein